MRLARIEVGLVEMRNFTAKEGSSYHVNLSCGGVDVTSNNIASYLPLLWKESFNFNFIIKESTQDSLGGSLRIALFETGKGAASPRFIGEISIRLESLPANAAQDTIQALRSRGASSAPVEGEMRIITTYYPDSTAMDDSHDSESIASEDTSYSRASHGGPGNEEIEQLHSECARLRSKVATQEDEIESLQAQLSSISKAAAQAPVTPHSPSDAADTIARLSARVSALESELRQARSDSADAVAQATRDAATKHTNKHAQLMADIRDRAGVMPTKAEGDELDHHDGGAGSEDAKKLKVLRQAYLKLRADNAALQEAYNRLASELEQAKSERAAVLDAAPSGSDSSAVQALKKDREVLMQQMREKDLEIDEINNKNAGERKKMLAKLMEAKEQISILTQERNGFRDQLLAAGK